MYLRYAERRRLEAQILDATSPTSAGYKDVQSR